jgi:DUF3016 family protein
MSAGRLPTIAVALATAIALTAAGPADAARPRVAVEFVRPEKFADVKASARSSEAAGLRGEVERVVVETGERLLPPGRSVAIPVTDVELAGEFEPRRGPQFAHTRFMREVFPPRIELEFRVQDALGRVLAEGRRTLRAPLYLTRSVRAADDRLRYEKSLLADWLRAELAR